MDCNLNVSCGGNGIAAVYRLLHKLSGGLCWSLSCHVAGCSVRVTLLTCFLKLLWRVSFCSFATPPHPFSLLFCCRTCVCILIHSFLLRVCLYVCVRVSAFLLVLSSPVCLGHILMHNIPSIKLWLNAECVRTWQLSG